VSTEPTPEGGWPVRGTVEVNGDVTSWNMPCVSEWLSEHESGDITEQIENAVRAKHEEGVEYAFRVSRRETYQILGEAEEVADGE